MSQPYIGEIRMFAGNFAPMGWAFCDGSLISISENDALFNLIGTTYGGDGETTFGLPDLRGRIPLHMGSSNEGMSFTIGESGGSEEVSLNVNQIPSHTHGLLGSSMPAESGHPENRLLAKPAQAEIYKVSGQAVNMAPASIGPAGGSQPHSNMQPYLCISFIISLFGIYPLQT